MAHRGRLRIAIGGRANPYRFGSRINKDGAVGPDTVDYLTGNLHTVLPGAREHPDRARLVRPCWPCRGTGRPASSTTSATGIGEAGGYVGHGVTATNLAGRTLADLILKRHTDLTVLPWVDHSEVA